MAVVKRSSLWFVVASLFVSFVLAGCEKHETPPEPVSEELVQTILAELRQAINPLSVLVQPSPEGPGVGEGDRGAPYGLTKEMQTQAMEAIKAAVEVHQKTSSGREALSLFTHDVIALAKEAQSQKRWKLALAAIDVYELLHPGNPRFMRLREQATAELERPRVVLLGFFDDNVQADTYVFLQVTLPPSNEVKKVHVRPGEEFLGLRFVDIIGKNKGIILEYLRVPGENFKVMGL